LRVQLAESCRYKSSGCLRLTHGRESFEDIHLDLSKQPGKCRIADTGLGWKPSGGGETFTLDSNNIVQAQWSRALRGFEVKIYTRKAEIHQLDGFQQEVCRSQAQSMSPN